MTDTADLADIVLPATMQPEHADLHDSYGHLYLSWNEPAVPAPGECLPNSEILRRIAARLGFDHPALQISDLDFAAEMLGQAGIELDDLRAEGFLRIGPPRDTAPFADGGIPDARAVVSSSSRRRSSTPGATACPPTSCRTRRSTTSWPSGSRWCCSRPPAGSSSTRRSRSWTGTAARWARPTIWLHPADAAARGLIDGDTVRCHNDRGAWTAALAVSDATRPGVCFTLKTQWPKLSPGGENVNACTPERDTDIGGGPTFHDNRVEVSAAV